ncbi:PEP-CTERM sorting domain-containing protein [Microcoleus sp. B5-D4]|uniref:PEP-CTERM sorting domain-containing protein n=1 Tax=unclassified Microcoleus TaxID=2642155 RepID=UPI002FCEF76A
MKFTLNLVKSILAVAGVAALSAVSAAPASAIGFAPNSSYTFGFNNIAGKDTPGDAYNSNFKFDVIDKGTSVLFNIFNSGNAAAPNMFIRQVFFDDNNYLSNPVTNVGNDVTKVMFNRNAKAGQLPQGGNGFVSDYEFTSATGNGNAFGIQGGEMLGLQFTGNYGDVLTALTKGSLKLGLHVQSLPKLPGQSTSDSYISSTIGTSNTEATPEPLTMLAAGAAVGFGTMFKKQRAQAQKAE